MATVERACEVMASIADTFELAYLTQHLAHLDFGDVTKVVVAYMPQVVGDFGFHLIGYLFLMVYLVIVVFDFLAVLLVEHIPDDAEHLLYVLGKAGGFLLCLQD